MRYPLFKLYRKCTNILKSILISSLLISSGCVNKDRKEVKKTPDFRNEIFRGERFALEKNKDYTRLTIINPWQGVTNLNQTYFLIKGGCNLPNELKSSTVIYVPVKKIICLSTSHAAMISALGEDNSITGMSGTRFLYNNTLFKLAEKGLIKDVGYEENLNKELIIKILPDLIMMYGIGSESERYIGKIKELGFKVIFNADYLENDPLGRAEWIKVFGALFCKENMADSIYNSEVEKYDKLKIYIKQKIVSRPKVLLGYPFKDTWYISPGNSFINKIIEDAGGEYIWQNTVSSVSMPLGLENVYLRALTADFWLNIGSVKNKEDIAAVDQRLKELPCFKNGNMYNNNKRVNLYNGNDYWESGSVFPHIILQDIATILHPEIFSGNELFFYQKIN